jgi:ferredoxin
VSALVEVAFVPAGRRVWVRPGTDLVAAGLAAEVEIVTGCTEGMCGTDPVRILAGAEGLSTAEPHEIGTLERMGLGAGYRLACSARVLRGRIEVATDSF